MERLKHERNDALEEVNILKVISKLASLYFLYKKEKTKLPFVEFWSIGA